MLNIKIISLYGSIGMFLEYQKDENDYSNISLRKLKHGRKITALYEPYACLLPTERPWHGEKPSYSSVPCLRAGHFQGPSP